MLKNYLPCPLVKYLGILFCSSISFLLFISPNPKCENIRVEWTLVTLLNLQVLNHMSGAQETLITESTILYLFSLYFNILGYFIRKKEQLNAY